nr:DMT family transporter [uncultured Glaciecola sp.]
MDPVKKSLISLHLTVMLLGGTALFSQFISLGAVDITFGRSVIACLLLFVAAKLAGERLWLNSSRDYLIAFGLGIIMAVHWVTYFMAMQLSSVSVGIIALFTFPVITVFIEPYFEKNRLQWQDVVSALVVLAGIALIVPDASLENDVTLGVIVGVFSAFLYAIRNLLHRHCFSHYSGTKAMAWQTLIICPTLIFFTSDELIMIDANTLWLLVALGTFFTAVPHAMIANSLKHLRAKTFSLVACMQPFYAIVFAMILINEQPTWQTLIGGLLVISAAVYETINTHRENQKAKKCS